MKKVQYFKLKKIAHLFIKKVLKNLMMIYKNQGMNRLTNKIIKKVNKGSLIPS